MAFINRQSLTFVCISDELYSRLLNHVTLQIVVGLQVGLDCNLELLLGTSYLSVERWRQSDLNLDGDTTVCVWGVRTAV